MHLPKYFTKVTPFSKLIAALCFIIIPFITFYIGLQVQNSASTERKNAELEQLQEKIKENEEEIQLLILDRGKYLRQYNNKYTYADFGIYSPLFEGQEVTNMVYTYKRQTITQKSITLQQDKRENKFYVTLWAFENKNNPSNEITNDFVIFDGYENHTLSPTRVSDIMASWKDSYKNANDIPMYWSISTLPKGQAYAINLEFLQKYPPSGHPSLVRLSASIKEVYGKETPDLNSYKNELKKFADTISLRKR